jgi:hypothetical protein
MADRDCKYIGDWVAKVGGELGGYFVCKATGGDCVSNNHMECVVYRCKEGLEVVNG